MPRGRRFTAVLTLLSLVAAGCGDDGKLGPPTPTGATDIGGPSVTSAPPPPPGWSPKDVVPQSQQQAQDTLLDYLTRTVRQLPKGSVLDATRYGSSGHNSWCEDEPKDPKNVPTRFHTTGDLTVPAGINADALVRQVGDIWRSWGWYVYERDGFRTPNEFGYGPDGYRLQIVTAGRPGYAPTLSGSSPCFPGEIAADGIPFPLVVNPA
ncbi:hypothetical protein MDOR_10390 [Mycolicibacterium doricum]|uniref:Lipoprotein n=1 Tax=Mycolicibacterium doricum TaxID=126673 RepID=A0A1X1SWC2_9MYCO|nr:hypothetical protein [Mycolicibacterium doricum]ORV35218.1 hypothetical protein AWC01_00800 [Mycolicibacterium doricum]BBZ06870.1 hypothetical protein MDOR_10390 [Mycolicibacterium doricum]